MRGDVKFEYLFGLENTEREADAAAPFVRDGAQRMTPSRQDRDPAAAQLRLAAERFGLPLGDAAGERVIPVRDCRAIVTPIPGSISSVVDVLHVSDHTMSMIYRVDDEPRGDVFVAFADLGPGQTEIMMRIMSSRRIADSTWHVEMRSAGWDPYAGAGR
jgi:hypothetical protein